MSERISTYEQAKGQLELVKPFSPSAQIIFDPSVVPEDGWPGAGKFDEATGSTIYPVPANTQDDKTAAYSLFGKVAQPDLAVPPSAYQVGGAKAKVGEKVSGYVLAPTVEGTFQENVAALEEQAVKQSKAISSGHPLYNQGIKFGPCLVAVGQLVMDDMTVNTNTVVVLVWSNRKFSERQEQG